MLNPIAKRLLALHYAEAFQPLTEPEFAEREDAAHPCRDLAVMRMLCRRPDGQLMQVLGTIGASAHRLPREQGGGEARNEYVTFIPADWDLDDEKHQWILDMLGDLADYTVETKRPLTYGHSVDMYGSDRAYLPDDVNMTSCMLMHPFGGRQAELLTCRTGLLRRVSIIHMMPVTDAELPEGCEQLEKRFWPESGEVRFLCARKR